ncbi:MAG TPA: helix-hairpin-helix domain-containing protein [Vicinamibacterales bacterium]|jgi:competence protein ComEA
MRSVFLMIALLAGFAVSAPAQTAAPASTAKTTSRASTAKATASAPVNLNTATEAQLQTLPGVGAKVAQRIIEYRQKNGTFKKAEDLMNVRGIGEKNFLKIKPLVTISNERATGTDR